MFKDIVHVADRAFTSLRTRAGEVVAGRTFEDSKSVVEVKGWVELCMRERGKIVPGSRREGHNVWTNTGREYLPLLMSFSAAATPFRDDRMAYIMVGSGSFVEDSGVDRLANPIPFIGSTYLAALDIPPTFPLTPSRTTVRYHRVFAENEITTGAVQVNISEMGLYTNGNPANNYIPPRILTLNIQAPVAYKSFEPIGKTPALELEVSWEIRF